MRGVAAALAAVAVACACNGICLAGGTTGSLALLGTGSKSASGVSSDGRVVVGYSALEYWMWTPELGIVPIGGIAPGYQGAGGSGAVSDDGARIGFNALNGAGKTEGAFYEVATGEVTLIGNYGASCDISATSCWSISGDGQAMVGLGWQTGCAANAYSWRQDTGLVTLPSAYFYEPTRANGCNRDGSVIVGWQDGYTGLRHGAVWRNGVETLIYAPGNLRMGEAAACDAAGNWVVGIGNDYNNNLSWRWSPSTGYVALPDTPIPGYQPYAVDISADATRILMFYRVPFPPATNGEGYLWINGDLVSLEEYARAQGIDVPLDVHMALPLAISSDGYTIVGGCRSAAGVQAFVLDLPRPAPNCPADLTHDGTVSAPDIAALLSAWGSGGNAADLNGDGVVSAPDIAALLSAWGACP